MNSTKNNHWLEKNPIKSLSIFILFIIIIILFVVESILNQKLHIEKPSQKRYVYIREMIPNKNTVGVSDQKDKLKIKIRTDNDSLLLPNKIHESPYKNIFFIGSSTILTLPFEEKNRLYYVTGRLLEKKLNKRINTYNAAAGSSSSFHGMNILINKILPYEPDYLVFMYNTTDLADLRISNNHYWKNNYQTIGGDGIFEVLRYIKNSLFPNIYFVIKKNLDFDITKTISIFLNGSKIITQESSFENFNYEKAKYRYKQNLKAIISIAKIYNIKPIIMTEPYSIKDAKTSKVLARIGLKEYLKYQNKFNNLIRQLAIEENILLVDLAKNMNFENNEYLFADTTWHFSLKGINKASRLISDTIYTYEKNNLKP